MAGQVYFGNGNYQTWIAAPQTGLRMASVGFISQQTGINGRGFLKRSRGSHREFSASWLGSLNSTSNSLQTIKDFCDGVYGDGPFYWLDPYAIDQNLMPAHWAVPSLAEKDWPKMRTDGTYSVLTNTLTTNGYPIKYVRYANLATSGVIDYKKTTIIIPTGYKLNFGWHSINAGVTGVRITPYLRSTGAATTDQNPVSILAGTTTRVSTVTTAGSMAQFDGATYSKVDIFLAGQATVDIVAMIAQITPTATTPATGSFITGRGTKALEFLTFPEIEYYSAAINNGQVGMTASFIEVD